MHLAYNMLFNLNQHVPKGPATKLDPILQPVNLFAFALPPSKILPRNWRIPGPFWRKFTIPKESTNNRLDLLSL